MSNGRRIRRQPQRSGLVVKDRLIRHQPGRGSRIPGGITPEDFLEITEILRRILRDLDQELRNPRATRANNDGRPKELHIRINESDKPFPFPVFAGWVEADDVRRTREDWNHPDPGLHRFGDDVYSEIYGEAFRFANHPKRNEHFRFRDWEKGELLEKRSGEKATDPKAGNRFQTCLAIVARVGGQLRAVGTLVVGFRHRPSNKSLTKTQRILREWAREPDTTDARAALVNFLTRRFDLGGPRLRDSNWVARI
jgi:hypothetical protein